MTITQRIDVGYRADPGRVHVYPLTPTPEDRDARADIVERLPAVLRVVR